MAFSFAKLSPDIRHFHFTAGALRQAFGGAYIASNGYDRQRALDVTASGRADMVAFGRDFIGNPDLVGRL